MLSSFCSPVHGPPDASIDLGEQGDILSIACHSEALDQYIKLVQLCSDLGGEIVNYVAGWQVYGTTREQAWEWSRSALQSLSQTAKTAGITIVIEPTTADSNLVDSCDDALQMMHEVGEPNVKLMFDTCHTIYRNKVSSDYVYRFGKDLWHVHLADSNRLPPSEGTGEIPSLIVALQKTEFDGYLTMEIGFNRRDVDPDAFARRAHDYIRSLVSAGAQAR